MCLVALTLGFKLVLFLLQVVVPPFLTNLFYILVETNIMLNKYFKNQFRRIQQCMCKGFFLIRKSLKYLFCLIIFKKTMN